MGDTVWVDKNKKDIPQSKYIHKEKKTEKLWCKSVVFIFWM